jgi:hypothetical protein
MVEEPLADQAFMVRGGLMEVIGMRLAADTCERRHGFCGLSFWGDNGLSVEQVLAIHPLDHGQIRISTVGRVRALGLEPRRWGAYPHLTIRFLFSPTDEQLEELAATFDPPVPNPLVSP